MKAITERTIRDEVKGNRIAVYCVPKGKILTPAAREYLNQLKIKISFEETRLYSKTFSKENIPVKKDEKNDKITIDKEEGEVKPVVTLSTGDYIDHETGAIYTKKPECMTHLKGKRLVYKNNPRIVFRGRLDSLQAQIILAQAEIFEKNGSQELITDLSDALRFVRELLRCDFFDEAVPSWKLIGLTKEELREYSHNSKEHFGVNVMVLPDYTMGAIYARLNLLRTLARETEISAVRAYKASERLDIIEALNRLSSCFHVIMCKYLSKRY